MRWLIIKSNALDGAEFEAALLRSYSREFPNAFGPRMQDIAMRTLDDQVLSDSEEASDAPCCGDHYELTDQSAA